MSCEGFEEKIALASGGDLAAVDAERLARHLRVCGKCRRFADDMRDSRRAVRSLASVPVEREILVGVRAGVLRRLERSQRRRPAPWWLAAAAGCLLAAGAALLLRSGGQDPYSGGSGHPGEAVPGPRVATTRSVPEPAAPGPAVPVPANTEMPAPEPFAPPAIPSPSALASAPAASSVDPLVIKLVSEDADLVIYWLVNPPQKKEKEMHDETSAV